MNGWSYFLFRNLNLKKYCCDFHVIKITLNVWHDGRKQKKEVETCWGNLFPKIVVIFNFCRNRDEKRHRKSNETKNSTAPHFEHHNMSISSESIFLVIPQIALHSTHKTAFTIK